MRSPNDGSGLRDYAGGAGIMERDKVRGGRALGVAVGIAVLVLLIAGGAGALIVNDTIFSSDLVTETNLFPAGVWVEKSDTPIQGGLGEAIAGTGSYIYAIRSLNNGYSSYFWKYDPAVNNWQEIINWGDLPDSNLPRPKSGTALAWDNSTYIYAMFGGAYNDTNRNYFYRYSVTNNTWESLSNTTSPQGAGDAITWSGYDGYIYAITGSNEHGTAFARYKYNSWEVLDLNPNWTVTDDGASLVWTGGEYLYALRGEYNETVPNGDFARYHIPTQTWEDMKDIPVTEGVGDGASLLWVREYPDYIFAFSGGGANENPAYNFYRYSISTDSWEQLESIPYPIGYYVGNRLGFANGHIYYWQGAPSTWLGGGNKFFMFEQPTITDIPLTNITISPNPAIVLSGQTQQFTATGRDANGNIVSITPTWNSSNITVGTINQTGLFTASTPGATTITAKNGTVSGTASATVTAQEPVLANITVSTSPANLNPQPTGGGTYNSGDAATVTAQSVIGYTFQKWTENDNQVSASASYSFTVTGDRSLVAEYSPIPALANITVAPATVKLPVGNTTTFTATVRDQAGNIISVNITWTSNNTTVGTINATGVFTALAQGTTTVMAANGTINGTALVAVTSAAAVKGDTNGNGARDVGDGLFALQAVAGLRTLTPEQETAAEVNGNGVMDVADGLFILQAVAGLRVL